MKRPVFVRVPDLLAAFPDPATVTIEAMRARFGSSYEQASHARALAIRRVEENRLMAEFGLSRDEAGLAYEPRRHRAA